MGLPHDGEEAHLWLSRAARQLGEVLGVGLQGDKPAAGGSSGSGSSGSSSGSGSPGSPARPLPALMSAADCRRILAQVRLRERGGRWRVALGPCCRASHGGSRDAVPACSSSSRAPLLLPTLQVTHILGYLCLDGEGCRVDVPAALRWFRLSEAHGCLDAGRMIGSLLNTGQFG